jgi:hypothetical protein
VSVLAHLCRRCGHGAAWHEPTNRGYHACPCCREGGADLDPEPTLLPTSSSPGGVPEPLWWPGTRRNEGTMHASTTCGCRACRLAAAAMSPRDVGTAAHPVAG